MKELEEGEKEQEKTTKTNELFIPGILKKKKGCVKFHAFSCSAELTSLIFHQERVEDVFSQSSYCCVLPQEDTNCFLASAV